MIDEAWTKGGTAVADDDCDINADGDGTGDPTSRLMGGDKYTVPGTPELQQGGSAAGEFEDGGVPGTVY